jgi:hypothetical protein
MREHPGYSASVFFVQDGPSRWNGVEVGELRMSAGGYRLSAALELLNLAAARRVGSVFLADQAVAPERPAASKSSCLSAFRAGTVQTTRRAPVADSLGKRESAPASLSSVSSIGRRNMVGEPA